MDNYSVLFNLSLKLYNVKISSEICEVNSINLNVFLIHIYYC